MDDVGRQAAPMHRRASRLLGAPLVVLLASCTLPSLTTPTPRPSVIPTAPATTPVPTPTVSARPTPSLASIPRFRAAELITTATDGLRVRQRPGLSGTVITGLLPLDSELQAVMGPIVIDDHGWYLVTDADPDEPQFEEGWIAAGYEPEPFIRSSGRVVKGSPLIDSYSGSGNAEHGPIDITDDDHAIRWIVLDPEQRGCSFSVSLAAGDADPVPAIRATVGAGVIRGDVQPGSFPDVRGQVFMTVTSDCDWALVFIRVPEPEPEP